MPDKMHKKERKSKRPTHKKPPRALPDVEDDTENLLTSSRAKLEDLGSKPELSSKSLPGPKAKHTSASTQDQHNHTNNYEAHEMTNIPGPIPDTGLPPPSDDSLVYNTPPPLSPQASSAPKAPPTHAYVASHAASKSTFVPLPSLVTLNLSSVPAQEAAVFSPSLRPGPTPQPTQSSAVPPAAGQHARPPPAGTHRLSTTAIIALSVSGGLAILILAILVRLIRRPRKRKTPTPSLPILQDETFPDEDKFEMEASPVFGGKERFSPSLRNTKGNTGLWTWTQYQSGIPKPAPTVTVTRSSSQDQIEGIADNSNTHERRDISTGNQRASIHARNQNQYLFTGIGHLAPKNTSAAPLQPVQSAITRAVSRLSTVSMSLYPNSPGGYSQVAADVGLAIDGAAVDDYASPASAMQRQKERIAASRNRASMLPPANAKDLAALRRSQSFAYGGMEPASPVSPAPNRAPPNGGRARIKSTYYTPGLYPRTSTAPTSYPKHDHDRERADGNCRQQNPGVQRSNSHRGRDLTSALGLASPVPPSPQPTLYPDDSMSVIGEAKKVIVTGRSQKKPVPKQSSHYDKGMDSPPSDAAALGSLMMVDYAASKSTASLVNIRPSEAARGREAQTENSNGYLAPAKTSLKKRVEDKPPRVPSPPPMPSLAQMALQHGNPEAYADYHSPTYSIYGLYDGDRKSRGTSFGY
ncbi:hypothetical protein HYDPIDRAFT_164896 [Hydnomerulius pinastri MD-312]|nr:hypothetical protein HYDPIDRAFT_164896 [Hydnomerulius pinastri MD-312]